MNRAIPDAETAPTLTLPRKRERERTALGVNSSHSNMDTITPSRLQVEPPLPLAGEGWGGGLSAMEVSMGDEKDPGWAVSSRLRSRARELRKNSTDAERILWSELRDHRLDGIGFKRQVPIK